MKRFKHAVSKWHSHDFCLCFFTAMLCAFSTGITSDTGLIGGFIQLHAFVFFFGAIAVLLLKTFYRIDRELPYAVKLTALILRVYCYIIAISAAIFGILHLSEYADNAANH